MNIVKFKDIVLTDACKFSKFFNENLKGKYAYWVKMRYIFPLNSLDYKTYIQYEQLDNVYMLDEKMLPHIDLYSEECCMFNFAQDYIDIDATELANNINDFRTANEYVADSDIDINKLRNFRAWLANEILLFNTSVDGSYLDNLTSNQIHMLEFYKNNMYNDIVKTLSIFGMENAFTTLKTNTCGCCNSINTVNLTNTVGCNSVDIYVNNIHNLMVQTFENIDFWMQFNKDFLSVFKKYIDNIIKTGLIINKQLSNELTLKCNCNDDKINAANNMLKKLSEALEYMINSDIKGHVNFIHDALYNWADQLYDKMSWDIK